MQLLPLKLLPQMMQSVKGIARAKLIIDTGGPNCFWVASAKAFSQISQKNKGKLFASVDDIAKALGMPMSNLFKIPNLQTYKLTNRHGVLGKAGSKGRSSEKSY